MQTTDSHLPLVGGLYRHFKGDIYRVHSLDRDADAPLQWRIGYHKEGYRSDSWSRLASNWSAVEEKFTGWCDSLPDGSDRFSFIGME